MTLSFSQKFPDKSPTNFVEKIWEGLYPEIHTGEDYFPALEARGFGIYSHSIFHPKIHTIRRVSKNRWREGMAIHFAVNNRTKNRLQFAPILPVRKIQTFELKYLPVSKDPLDLQPMIWIDEYIFYDPATGKDCGIEQLAKNDGFDSVEKFFQWFSSDFTGEIIHWTDFSYSSNIFK